MKKNIKRAVKMLALVLAVLMFVSVTQIRADKNKIKLDGFYLEEKNSLDVVLLGASEVYTAFSSALAYEEYGFTSYPYAVEANYVDLFESQIKEIYSRQNPKVLLVEMNGALYDKKMKKKDVKVRRFTDCMPLSQNKIDTINQFGKKGGKLSYYCPWVMYHGSKDAFREFPDAIGLQLRGYSLLKGNSAKTGSTFKGKVIDVEGDTSERELPSETEASLRNFLQFCKDSNLKNIVFAKFPHRITTQKNYKRFQMGNTMGRIIKEYGFDYLDFENNYKAVELDDQADFYNDDHMNIRGQKKFTKYLGNVLAEKYKVGNSTLSEKNKAQWDESVEYLHLYYDYYEQCKKDGKKITLYENNKLISELNKLRNTE